MITQNKFSRVPRLLQAQPDKSSPSFVPRLLSSRSVKIRNVFCFATGAESSDLSKLLLNYTKIEAVALQQGVSVYSLEKIAVRNKLDLLKIGDYVYISNSDIPSLTENEARAQKAARVRKKILARKKRIATNARIEVAKLLESENVTLYERLNNEAKINVARASSDRRSIPRADWVDLLTESPEGLGGMGQADLVLFIKNQIETGVAAALLQKEEEGLSDTDRAQRTLDRTAARQAAEAEARKRGGGNIQ